MTVPRQEASRLILWDRIGSLSSQPKSITVLFLSLVVVFNWVRHEAAFLLSHLHVSFPFLVFCPVSLLNEVTGTRLKRFNLLD